MADPLAERVRGRFAPSPTGEMHLGNARTALLAWLQTREAGGAFVLRLEDLDTGRVRPGAAETILRDLAWLGLHWDEGPDVGGPRGPYRQSERTARYAAAAGRLPTYPCTCTRREAQEAASAPHGGEARYPGTCRAGPTHPKRPAALRLRVPGGEVCFEDVIHGPVCEDVATTVGDFVVRRADGAWAYQLAVVVDDIEMSVTDVLRGDDLLPSTARQCLLYRMLGAEPPRFCHVPLMTDYRGERLAKRGGAPSLRQLREGGASAGLVVADLARSLGWAVGTDCQPADLLGRFGPWARELRREDGGSGRAGSGPGPAAR